VLNYLRECNGSDGENFENKEDDKRIAVHENSTELEHDGQYDHSDGHLSECCDEPCQPMNCIVQTHHSHYLHVQERSTHY